MFFRRNITQSCWFRGKYATTRKLSWPADCTIEFCIKIWSRHYIIGVEYTLDIVLSTTCDGHHIVHGCLFCVRDVLRFLVRFSEWCDFLSAVALSALFLVRHKKGAQSVQSRCPEISPKTSNRYQSLPVLPVMKVPLMKRCNWHWRKVNLAQKEREERERRRCWPRVHYRWMMRIKRRCCICQRLRLLTLIWSRR